MNTRTIRTEQWLDPEQLMLIHTAINREIDEALSEYRKALKSYATAHAAREGGTVPRKEAVQAQEQTIAEGVEQGLSPTEIFERVGDEVTFMSNGFAVKVADLYQVQAKAKRKVLLSVLKRHAEVIETYLLEKCQSHPDSANALDVIKGPAKLSASGLRPPTRRT